MTRVDEIVDRVATERQRVEDRTNLRGTCAANSVHLAEALHEANFTPELVWGWMDVQEADSPSTLREAHRQAVAHVWVELSPGVTVLELASSAPGHRGEAVVLQSRPELYRPLERYEYRPTFTPESALLDTYEACKQSCPRQ